MTSPDQFEPVTLVLKDPSLIGSAVAIGFAAAVAFGLWVWHLIEAVSKNPRPPHDDGQYPPTGFP